MRLAGLAGLIACAPVFATAEAPEIAYAQGPAAVAAITVVDQEGVVAPRIVVIFANGVQRDLVFDDAGRPRLRAGDAVSLDPGLPSDGLPQSQPGFGFGDIETAWLIAPTDRYDHGVLGDGLEAAGLRVRPLDGADVAVLLDDGSVFEDLTPRIVDLDFDGRDEVITMRSSAGRGAALSVYGLREGRLVRLGETAPIGQSHRWLNPIGAGDVTGDGRIEIVTVETPHIGGIVKIWRYEDGEIALVAERAGYSNHALGSTALGLGMLDDLDVDGKAEILVPDQPRTSIAALTVAEDAVAERWRLSLGAAVSADLLPIDLAADARPEIVIGLDDGRVGVMRFD